MGVEGLQVKEGLTAMRMTLAILTLCLSVVPVAAQSPLAVRPHVVLIVTDASVTATSAATGRGT
jgi:hypothetical protein